MLIPQYPRSLPLPAGRPRCLTNGRYVERDKRSKAIATNWCLGCDPFIRSVSTKSESTHPWYDDKTSLIVCVHQRLLAGHWTGRSCQISLLTYNPNVPISIVNNLGNLRLKRKRLLTDPKCKQTYMLSVWNTNGVNLPNYHLDKQLCTCMWGRGGRVG